MHQLQPKTTIYQLHEHELENYFAAADRNTMSTLTSERIRDQWKERLAERNIEVKTKISVDLASRAGCLIGTATGALMSITLGWNLFSSCIGISACAYCGRDTGNWIPGALISADPTALSPQTTQNIIKETISSFVTPHVEEKLRGFQGAVLDFQKTVQIKGSSASKDPTVLSQRRTLIDRIEILRSLRILRPDLDTHLVRFREKLLNIENFQNHILDIT